MSPLCHGQSSKFRPAAQVEADEHDAGTTDAISAGVWYLFRKSSTVSIWSSAMRATIHQNTSRTTRPIASSTARLRRHAADAADRGHDVGADEERDHEPLQWWNISMIWICSARTPRYLPNQISTVRP